jgi:hypothetical protein
MKEVGRTLLAVKELIALCEPCKERDDMQARLDLMIARLRDYPRRVAARGPFATGAEAEAVMREELEFVLAAWEPMH